MKKEFIFIGPPGSGKGRQTKMLAKDSKLALSISATTRQKRSGEMNGREYYFLSKDVFEQKIKVRFSRTFLLTINFIPFGFSFSFRQRNLLFYA